MDWPVLAFSVWCSLRSQFNKSNSDSCLSPPTTSTRVLSQIIGVRSPSDPTVSTRASNLPKPGCLLLPMTWRTRLPGILLLASPASRAIFTSWAVSFRRNGSSELILSFLISFWFILSVGKRCLFGCVEGFVLSAQRCCSPAHWLPSRYPVSPVISCHICFRHESCIFPTHVDVSMATRRWILTITQATSPPLGYILSVLFDCSLCRFSSQQ